ncbi:MAG: ParB/RepB/Spo0J family partition protein [Oscillochloridaceae bacterium]|nr:ParB/RepB/Spo0J family partition protein [Chloroflexaceae bacterium]MDW8390521.1 ParB/RepB/Spo0J family partition protein [Oscillochloridaceae bacterium]
MNRRRGLGSGLDALIPGAAGDLVRQAPIEAIRENRNQPRTVFDEQALDELAASIREHGLIQPLIVSEAADGGYELIAGERRLRAARRAGLREVPVIVKDVTPQQVLEIALVENVQRADLNPLEEGLAYQTLKDEFGLTDDEIARRVGKSRVAVVNTRRLIRLVAPARQALLDGALSAGHGRALLRFEDPADQEAAFRLVRQRDFSVREAERLGDIANQPALASATRSALLRGQISLAQAEALARIEDADLQVLVLERITAVGCDERETAVLADLVNSGLPLEQALARVRPPLTAGEPGRRQRDPRGAQSETRRTRSRVQSPEDAEAQRMFEEILETPVQLSRSGNAIRLTITLYSDEQLQALYDRLSR